ncbi:MULTISPECIES: precorrin-8X methylmutase [Anaerosinus]|uniref:Precorrin-8X methylmutase n=1 Tax=Selenobaculum gibii TaxID=3054208 RepID=A0A9Y2ALC4_9FIRM|nr:precorrin-8X methylmutase [Selenobaculum gbiensis]WIW71910.1 precorrin-8X methylmutase [Selenobaculum gbiensis]
MNFITIPSEIERRSMEIIAPYLKEYHLSEEEIKVYSRIIHASGDPEYAPIIKIHQDAISKAKAALLNGADIYTDVEMVRTGINKKRLAEYGGQVHCLIADPEVAKKAKEEGITRSMAAVRSFGKALNGSIVAIGNAPTALFEILHLMQQEEIYPALIIGVPVGFVGAAESKEHLMETSPVPYITVRGNKGGSPIAAAITNAILYML